MNFSKAIDTDLKTDKSTYITLNFYGQRKSSVFHMLFKDVNGFFWKQKFILNYYSSNKIKVMIPEMISPKEYSSTQSSKKLINYLLYKSYNNVNANEKTLKYKGIRNLNIDEKFEGYKKSNTELEKKIQKFNNKYNFEDFNLYE